MIWPPEMRSGPTVWRTIMRLSTMRYTTLWGTRAPGAHPSRLPRTLTPIPSGTVVHQQLRVPSGVHPPSRPRRAPVIAAGTALSRGFASAESACTRWGNAPMRLGGRHQVKPPSSPMTWMGKGRVLGSRRRRRSAAVEGRRRWQGRRRLQLSIQLLYAKQMKLRCLLM
jgi:hypothetical protein